MNPRPQEYPPGTPCAKCGTPKESYGTSNLCKACDYAAEVAKRDNTMLFIPAWAVEEMRNIAEAYYESVECADPRLTVEVKNLLEMTLRYRP